MKSWWKSKTVWWNIATMMVLASTQFGPLVDMFGGEYKALIQQVLVLANAIGNLILRVVTSTGLTR